MDDFKADPDRGRSTNADLADIGRAVLAGRARSRDAFLIVTYVMVYLVECCGMMVDESQYQGDEVRFPSPTTMIRNLLHDSVYLEGASARRRGRVGRCCWSQSQPQRC